MEQDGLNEGRCDSLTQPLSNELIELKQGMGGQQNSSWRIWCCSRSLQRGLTDERAFERERGEAFLDFSTSTDSDKQSTTVPNVNNVSAIQTGN